MDESVEKPSCFDPEVWIPYVRSPTYLAFRLFSVHSTLAIAATHRLTEIVLAGGDEDENADEFDLPDEDTVTCKIEFGWYLRRAYTTDCDGGGSESCDLVAVIAAVAGKPPLPDHRHLVIEISDDEDEDNDGAAEAAEDSDESDVDTEEGDTDQMCVLKRVYENLNESRKRVKTAVVAQSRVESDPLRLCTWPYWPVLHARFRVNRVGVTGVLGGSFSRIPPSVVVRRSMTCARMRICAPCSRPSMAASFSQPRALSTPMRVFVAYRTRRLHATSTPTSFLRGCVL